MSIPIPSRPASIGGGATGTAGLRDYADHCSSADSGVSSVSAAARFVIDNKVRLKGGPQVA